MAGAPWSRAVRSLWCGVAMAIPLLAGCTAAADEPPPPPATTSAEPTVEPSTTEPEPKPEPEPTPTGLVRPDAMDQNTDEGAIAAAEYFTLLVYEALRVSNASLFATMVDASCEFCSVVLADIEDSVSGGYTFTGGEVSLRGPGRVIGRDETLGVIAVDVPFSVAEQVKYRSDGTVVATWPDADEFLYVELAHGYAGWVVMTAHSHVVEY